MEDKTLSCIDSRREINSAASVNHEEKNKKGVMINLGLVNDKPGEEVDETPTPTRLIRNCEEVGLFQDLQNVNPFDEYFKKAVENRDYCMPPSNSTQPEDDSLHTPQIYLPQSDEPIDQVVTKPNCMGLNLDLIDSNNDDDENPLLIIINSDDENDINNGQDSRNLNNNDVHHNAQKTQNIQSYSHGNIGQDIRERNQNQDNIHINSNNGILPNTDTRKNLNLNITETNHTQNNVSNINVNCITDANNVNLRHNQNQINRNIIDKDFNHNNGIKTHIDVSQNNFRDINLECIDDIHHKQSQDRGNGIHNNGIHNIGENNCNQNDNDNIKEKVKSALIQKAQGLKTVPLEQLLEKRAVASSEEPDKGPAPRNFREKSELSKIELERRTANRYAQARTRARRRKQQDDIQDELVTLRREKAKLVKMNLALMDRVTLLERELQRHTTKVIKNDEAIPLHIIQKTKNGSIVKVAQVSDSLTNPTNAPQGLNVITSHSSQNTTLVNTSTMPINIVDQSRITSVPIVNTHSGITILDNTQIVPQNMEASNAVFVIMPPQNSSTLQNVSTE